MNTQTRIIVVKVFVNKIFSDDVSFVAVVVL